MNNLLVKVNDKMLDFSEIVTQVSFYDSLNNGCSVLKFSYVDQESEVSNGSVVSFRYEDTNLFYGYIFSVSKNNGKEIAVTAYDQLRYCKVKDSVVVKRDTVTTLTNRMCNYFNLKKGTMINTSYNLATDVKDDITWLDIIYSSIEETERNDGKKYLIRDEYGSICIRKLDELQLNLVIGDQKQLYDFNYSKTIDNDFYNQIKLNIKGNSNIEGHYILQKDTSSIKRFGLLQYYDNTYNTSSSKAQVEAKNLLKKFNKEGETLSLNCIGNIKVRAGTSIYGKISDINFYQRLIVKSVNHKFIPIHTMEVEAKLD